MSRWRWVISMKRGFVSESLYHHRCRSILARNPLVDYNYHGFSTSVNFSNSDPFTGFHESKHQMAVKEKEEPLNYNIGVTTLSVPNSWEELKKQNNQVQKGDVIDIRNFLFTEYRDYLIRFNDQTHVKAEQLAGKVIVLYFVPLSLDPDYEDCNTFHLKEVYNYQLKSHHGIEIVLVAIDDGDVTESKKRFEDIFSRMPWTAIPFSDEKCRKFLQTNFYYGWQYTSTCVVDSTGVVLQENADTIIKDYGALGFPFSDEKIKLLVAEENAAVERPSLMSLLGTPQRDYVINNKGEKVPIHTLEEKVVGLYFYDQFSAEMAQDIRTVYEEMSKTKQNFEVVLIYLADYSTAMNDKLFWETFETMPWLALPYLDPSLRKLKRIFDYNPSSYDPDHIDQQPELVIFGPHGEFIEPFGGYLIYINPVYPFTFEKIAKSLVEKVEKLKMEMLWHQDTVFRKTDGSQMRFSQLAGKRVILFFEKEYSFLPGFLTHLKEKYLELKGTDEEFEVIHFLENKKIKTLLPIHDLPWFVSLASELASELLADHGFDFNTCYGGYLNECVLLAFDRDGKLVRRTSCCTFADSEFPFFSGSLEEETLSQLIELGKCDYWNYYNNRGRIYTLKKKVREQPQLVPGCNYRVWQPKGVPRSKYRIWRMVNA